MLFKSVTSNITRIFIIANNLQPVTSFEHILNMIDTLVVTQKIRLEKESHSGLQKRITRGALKKDHTQDSKKGTHSGP